MRKILLTTCVLLTAGAAAASAAPGAPAATEGAAPDVTAPADASSAPPMRAPALQEAAPADKPRFRLLVLELKGNDVDAATVKTLEGIVTAGLAEYPELDVVSGEDLKNLLQLEAERETMGCDADAACMAEIADALGAELVVFGNTGRLDGSLVVNLNLFDSRKAIGLGRIVVQSESTKRLPRRLRPKLRELVGKFYADRGLALPPFVELPPDPEENPPSVLPWVATASGALALLGGGAAAVVGVIPLLQYDDARGRVLAAERQFADDPSALDEAVAAQGQLSRAREAWNGFGYLAVDAGLAVAAVGLVAGIAGLAWALTEGEPAPEPEPAPALAGGAR
jgi:hypothetical protein